MNDGRTLCECGIPLGECAIHGDFITTRIAERLNHRRFSYQTGEYHETELCGCLRHSFLERKHAHAVTFRQLLNKARGTSPHRQVLGFDPWSELPIRMTVEFGVKETISVVGHIDHFYRENKAIWELKSTRFVKWQDQKGMLPRKQDNS